MRPVPPCVSPGPKFLICTLERLAIRRIRRQFCERLGKRRRCLYVPSSPRNPYNRVDIVLFSLFVRSDRSRYIPSRRRMLRGKCPVGRCVSWHLRTINLRLPSARKLDRQFRYRFRRDAADWTYAGRGVLPRAFPIGYRVHRRTAAETVTVMLATWPAVAISFSNRLASVPCCVHCPRRPSCAVCPSQGLNPHLKCNHTCVPAASAGTMHYWWFADCRPTHSTPAHQPATFDRYSLKWKLKDTKTVLINMNCVLAKEVRLHFLFLGISGSFRRRRSTFPLVNGCIRSAILYWLRSMVSVGLIAAVVRKPSPSSSSAFVCKHFRLPNALPLALAANLGDCVQAAVLFCRDFKSITSSASASLFDVGDSSSSKFGTILTKQTHTWNVFFCCELMLVCSLLSFVSVVWQLQRLFVHVLQWIFARESPTHKRACHTFFIATVYWQSNQTIEKRKWTNRALQAVKGKKCAPFCEQIK